MTIQEGKIKPRSDTARMQDAAAKHAEEGHGEACRCKETSSMKPRELLRLMFTDLAFWKKIKNNQ